MINNEMLIGFGLVRLEDIVEPSASLRFKCTLEKIQTHAPKFLKSLKMYAVHSSHPGKKKNIWKKAKDHPYPWWAYLTYDQNSIIILHYSVQEKQTV